MPLRVKLLLRADLVPVVLPPVGAVEIDFILIREDDSSPISTARYLVKGKLDTGLLVSRRKLRGGLALLEDDFKVRLQQLLDAAVRHGQAQIRHELAAARTAFPSLAEEVSKCHARKARRATGRLGGVVRVLGLDVACDDAGRASHLLGDASRAVSCAMEGRYLGLLDLREPRALAHAVRGRK